MSDQLPLSSKDARRMLSAMGVAIASVKGSITRQPPDVGAAVACMERRVAEYCVVSLMSGAQSDSLRLTSMRIVGIAGAIIHDDIQRHFFGATDSPGQQTDDPLPKKPAPGTGGRPAVHSVLDWMARNGGGFASHLAGAWARADEINAGKLHLSFSDLYEYYERKMIAESHVDVIHNATPARSTQ